jgi:transcription factor IIIB 90 kDa subunit
MKLVCSNCRGSNIENDPSQGNSFCADCGAVLEENAVVSEVTFAELSSGASVLQGQFVSAEKGRVNAPSIFGRRLGPLSGSSSTVPAANAEGLENSSSLTASSAASPVISESREVTLANGKRRLAAVAVALGLGDHHVEMAHRWFTLALQHQFTRGRRSNNIIASCLYIVCRLERTPHMLLDFSDILQTSVYSLGGTFLRLTQLLNLELPLVDPSFYIGRFASKLEFAEKTQQVVNSALRIAARMKRDWIVTGRRPAGVCAAALIVAARMHGFRRTERQVVRIVHICEATLKKRLNEFASTPSSQLSLEEFEGIWLEQECDPPSYTTSKLHTAKSSFTESETESEAETTVKGHLDDQVLEEIKRLQDIPIEQFDILTPPMTPIPHVPTTVRINSIAKNANLNEENGDEGLSDLDSDDEVTGMLLSGQEIEAKTLIWSHVNAEFLEAQAEIDRLEQEKEISQTKDAPNQLENNQNNQQELRPKKPRKKRTKSQSQHQQQQQQTTTKLTGEPVADTPAEAAKQALSSKKLSKKINYEALESLLTNK